MTLIHKFCGLAALGKKRKTGKVQPANLLIAPISWLVGVCSEHALRSKERFTFTTKMQYPIGYPRSAARDW